MGSTAAWQPSAVVVTSVDRSRFRWIVTAGVFLVIIAAVTIPLLSVGSTINDVNQELLSNAPAVPAASAAPTGTAPIHASYLTTQGMRAGLAQIARLAPGARLAAVRVTATQISTSAQYGSDRAKEIVIGTNVGPNGFFVAATPATGERPISISQIRPAVVAKLVAQMHTRFDVPVTRISYIVLSSPRGIRAQWILVTTASGHPEYSATLGGSDLTRLPG